MYKILIIDDEKDIQSALAYLVKSEGYEAVVAGNGSIALKEISTHSPDLILLDIRLPGIDGMTLLKRIKEIDRNIIIIMLTGHGDIRDAVTAMKLGAFDYITKPFNNEDITAAIKNALQAKDTGYNSQSIPLSLREKEVLNWIKRGKSNWDISNLLGISRRTVAFHVSNIMQKLNVVRRSQAVAVAIERGLIDKE